MRRFFLSPEQINASEPLLGPDDAHHVRTVLRLALGENILVFDGTGAEYQARITRMEGRQVGVTLLKPMDKSTESPLEITLAQAYLKDKKMDDLARPLTELGVQRWLPFRAHRSVPCPDATRSQARLQRWQKISLEAVKQCGRGRAMAIDAPVSFQEALACSQTSVLKLIFWEGQGGAVLTLGKDAQPKPTSVFVMVGPEGGFEEHEHRAAVQQGFQSIHMGPRILRADTAAVVACALVQFVFGDMGQNVLDIPQVVL